jgi:hypothetical protein
MRRELELDPIAALWAVQALSRLLATAGFVLGLNVVIRPAWDSNEIYATALMLPGAPPSWGWMILALSFIIAFGQWRRKPSCTAAGHFGAAIWAFFFALSIAKTFWDTPTIPTGGIVTYCTIAVTHLVIAFTYRASR